MPLFAALAVVTTIICMLTAHWFLAAFAAMCAVVLVTEIIEQS